MTWTQKYHSATCTKCGFVNSYEIPKTIPKRPRMYCTHCNHRFDIKGLDGLDQEKTTPKKKVIEKVSSIKENIPPLQDKTSHDHTFIDDPNELLMSVAIRELNKPNPDPRWANILISCKKENITIKEDDIESFRKLPNQILANLLNKSKQRT